MRAMPRRTRRAVSCWSIGATFTAAVGLASALPAQTDSLKPSIGLALAAGPALAIGALPGTTRVGYVAQGSLTRTRPNSPWRVRGDAVYQHLGAVGEHMRYASDRNPGERGSAASAALALASVGFAHRITPSIQPYVLGGIGGGWVDEMRMADGLAQGGGAVRLAWQGGAGFAWARAGRVLSLESRVQSTRSALAPRWYTTVPLLLGVSF